MRLVQLAGVLTMLLLPTFAAAAQLYTVSLTSIGPDPMTLTARFSDRYVVDFGNTGYKVAGVSFSSSYMVQGPKDVALPLTGPEFWRLDVGPYTYGTQKETDEFFPIYTYENDETNEYRYLYGPAVIFKDGKVEGFSFGSETYSYGLPVLVGTGTACCVDGLDGRYNDGSGTYVDIEQYFPLPLGGGFAFTGFHFGETGVIPDAGGVWDYANSSVTVVSVPEPQTWGLLLIGFGFLGQALRARRVDRHFGSARAA